MIPIKKILIVDDEPDILEFLSYNFRKKQFDVIIANNGVEGLQKIELELPDIIISDILMPEMDGIAACEEIRKLPSCKNVVIAFLTARGEDYSQIAGFEAGADDYITKPVRPKVLISRVKALLKRTGGVASDSADNSKILTIGDIVIDKERYILIIDEKELTLPRKEFELLSLLVSKPDKVFTRDEIYKSVWGNNVIVGDRTIDVHIRKLREKIGNDHIRTLKGIGYKFIT